MKTEKEADAEVVAAARALLTLERPRCGTFGDPRYDPAAPTPIEALEQQLRYSAQWWKKADYGCVIDVRDSAKMLESINASGHIRYVAGRMQRDLELFVAQLAVSRPAHIMAREKEKCHKTTRLK